MKVGGIVLVILALVIGLVPIFTDCLSQGRVLTLANGREIPMKCHWTGMAAIATAIPLLIVGGLIALNRNRGTLRSLAVVGIALGGVAILLPTVLIGVCSGPEMICNIAMRPTLILAGILAAAVSLMVLLLSLRRELSPSEG